jgi:CheY-like chemotaxis protein
MRSSNLLLFMINDILDMTQITNGKLRIVPTSFSVIKIIKEVSKLIKFQAKKKGLAFIIENKFTKGSEIILRSDPNRLKQIILNLLGNALKFTERGYVKIIIEPAGESSEEEEEGQQQDNQIKSTGVMITVEDTGSGIKVEDIPRLFRLFGKLENSGTQQVNLNGVGLGLSISQSLLKYLNNNRVGCDIQVKSEWNKGSSFYFKLYSLTEKIQKNENDKQISSMIKIVIDREEKEEECDLEILDNNKIGPLTWKNNSMTHRVLIVDDDQINISVLTRYFQDFKDCVFDLAFNGLQAVETVKLKAKRNDFYDIILMDCNMPVMDGFTASKVILSLAHDGIIPPPIIIASTASASQLDHENCFKHGMTDIISKPFGKKQLREKMEIYLKNKND